VRVRLADARTSLLDTPPAGYSDDAPMVARDGRILFVRSHKGEGALFALHVGHLLGVGHDDGYYGHRAWSFLSWSLRRR
jgi:hypothetical protein